LRVHSACGPGQRGSGAGLAAPVGADGERAGQREAGGDLVAGRALGCGDFHATHRLRSAVLRYVHSIFLWKDREDGRQCAIARARDSRPHRRLSAVVGIAAGGILRPLGRAAVAPATPTRAKSLLWAAAKLADFAIAAGLEPVPQMVQHPSVTGRFTVSARACPARPAGRCAPTCAISPAGPSRPWIR
jgi:hypothetical protein